MKRLLILIVILLSFGYAIDMPNASEQFYVVQGMFADLNITPTDCPQKDDYVNFACGNYPGSFDSFKLHLQTHISTKLPGLSLINDWFDNAGAALRMYTSSTGTYFFAYNPKGFIVVAFIPK